MLPLASLLCSVLALSATRVTPRATVAAHPLPVRMCATDTASAQRYRVYLLNDSFNMREYVQRVLMMVCDFTESEAMDVMMQADWGFSAVVGSWEKPIADLVYDGMRHHGLQAMIEKEDKQVPEELHLRDAD